MNVDLHNMLDAYRMGHTSRAERILREYLEMRFRFLINEELVNVKTTPMAGAPDNGALIPNAYTTTKIPKSKKKLPTLKKGKYGVGGGWQTTPPSSEGGEGGDGGGE